MNTIDKIHIIKTLISSYACRGQSIHPRAYVMLPRASQSYSDDIMLTLITPYLNLLSALRHHCQKVQYIQIFHHQTSKPRHLYIHIYALIIAPALLSITTHLQSTSYVCRSGSFYFQNKSAISTPQIDEQGLSWLSIFSKNSTQHSRRSGRYPQIRAGYHVTIYNIPTYLHLHSVRQIAFPSCTYFQR